MDLIEIGHEDVNWVHLAQDRVHWQAFESLVMKLQIPKKMRNLLTS
jgi:hypothetical protein